MFSKLIMTTKHVSENVCFLLLTGRNTPGADAILVDSSNPEAIAISGV